MKTIIAITILFVLALCGCTPAQIKADVEAKVTHDVAVAVTPVAVPDLQAAAAAATAHGDTDGATCANEVLAYLTTLSNMPTPTDTLGSIKGIATAIEAQRIAASTPAATIPPVPKSLITGCAVVVFELKVSMLEFLNQFGLDAANLKLGGAIGSAQTLSLVKAAQAAQAVKP